MAAVRRRTGSGMGMWVFAATTLVVVAFVCLAGSIWFYEQLSRAKVTIRATDKAIEDTIGAVFREAGWELPDQEPAELGASYTLASMQSVEAQLRIAQTYEKDIQPLIGYKGGAETIKEAIAGAAVQDVVATTDEEGESQLLHASLEAVMNEYLDKYEKLTTANSALDADVKRRTTEAANLRTGNNDQAAAYEAKIAGLQQLYNDRVAELNKHKVRLEAVNATERTAKLKAQDDLIAKENERVAQVQQLKDQIAELENRIGDLTAPPFRAEEEQFGPEGKIVMIKPGFIVIDRGTDNGVKENAMFVVYSQADDGTIRRKGLVRVGQVNEATSVVLVVSQDEENPLAEKDPCVSLEKWQKFGKAAEGSS